MKNIGICVIGAGRAGMIHARNFRNKIEGARLVAVADPSEAAGRAACEALAIERWYADYHDALQSPEVDAVVVVSPTRFHRETVLAAAACGKHILCEKPMAMNETECDEMIFAAQQHGVLLQMAFMRRFDTSFETAREVLQAGEIGDLVLIKSLTRGPSVPKAWMYDIEASNGPLAEVNSHDIDTLRWFAGSEMTEVYAIAGNYRCADAAREYPDFYDNVLLSARFASGAQGSIDGAQGVCYGYDARVEILGTRGVIHLGTTTQNNVVVTGADGRTTRTFTRSWSNLFDEAYHKEAAHFVHCIMSGTQPKVTGMDGKMAVRVVKAGNASIVQKRIIHL